MSAQAYPLPNLFRRETLRDAHQLYLLSIHPLIWRGEAGEAVRQLRLVRRFARTTGVSPRHTTWTRWEEFRAQLSLGRAQAAWRVWRKHFEETFPRLLDEAPQQRVTKMAFDLRQWEVPAAYFSGRLRHAIGAMEAYLDWAMLNLSAEELRGDLFDGGGRPDRWAARVSLVELYAETGRTLSDWVHWKVWVKRLHSDLLAAAGLKAVDLAADPRLMKQLHRWFFRASREEKLVVGKLSSGASPTPQARALIRQHLARKQAHRAIWGCDEGIAMRRAHLFPWVDALRAPSEEAARASRKLSVDCMGLLNWTVALVREACDEAYFLEYRDACSSLMMEFVHIVNRVGSDFPMLVLPPDAKSDFVWANVPPAKVKAQVALVVRGVAKRVAEIRRRTPLMLGPAGTVDDAVGWLWAKLPLWRPKPTRSPRS